MTEDSEECRHFELTAPDPCLRGVRAAAATNFVQALAPANTTALVRAMARDIEPLPCSTQVKPPDIYTRTVVLRI
jgi:hypothetical protein